MYWNVYKREVKTGKIVRLVKSYIAFGISDYDMKLKALRYSDFRNGFRWLFPKYYYTVEFDFE